MSWFTFLFLIILLFFVYSCSSVKVCDALRCRREGSAGKYRPGYRKVTPREAPYIVVMLDKNNNPYCLGVLVDMSGFKRGHKVGMLTTCTCMNLESSFSVAAVISDLDQSYDINEMRKWTISASYSFRCNIANVYDAEDYAYALPDSKFPQRHYAYFKTNHVDVYRSYISGLMEKHENECFGFGYGGYDFIGEVQESFKHEGKKENNLQIFNYRLITDAECERYVPKCCGNWKDIGAKKEMGGSVHCAIRGRENSLCHGLLGSPIICDGYIIGFLKGQLKCSPDNKDYAGPSLYITVAVADILSFVNHKTDDSINRPKPECLEDSVSEFEIEEVFSDGDGKNGTGGAAGGAAASPEEKKKQKLREEEEYYYGGDATHNFLAHSLLPLAVTAFAQLLLYF